MLRKFSRLMLAALVAVISAISLSAPTFATVYSTQTSTSTNSFYFDDFAADYYLYRDDDGTSRMLVVEELTAVFPETDQNHGINRVIPFTNNNGKNLTMESDNTIYMDVERNGIEEPVSKVEIGDGYFDVYIGDASKYVHGKQVYTLTYEFENLVLDQSNFLEDDYGQNGLKTWQELYWDANGNDWSQRFNKVTARVHLDEDIIDDFTGETACYVGRYGATGSSRCKVTKIKDGVEFSAEKLTARETLTFALKFDADTFVTPPAHYDYRLIYLTCAELFCAVIMIILMIIAWESVSEKRKYYEGLFIKPEYTPPAGFTVAEMAANYLGKNLKENSKVATLLELAVQHKIEMVKTEKNGLLGKKKTEWVIRICSTDLAKEQVVVLKILAGSKTALHKGQEITVQSRSANSDLISLANKFDTYVQSALEEKGLANKSSKSKKKSSPENSAAPQTTATSEATKETKEKDFFSVLTIATVLWFIGCVAGFIFSVDEVPSYITMLGSPWLTVLFIIIAVAIFITSIIILVKTAALSTRTNKGLEYSRYLDGLKLYIKMAEQDRLNFLQSAKGADTSHAGVVKLYEKLLPYAAIFGLEKSWLAEMSRYYEFDDVSAPVWYVGIGAFSAREFSAAMASASSTMNSTIAYSTTSNSSSGGSGFSGGGGFAGGGGGGGGGGGW